LVSTVAAAAALFDSSIQELEFIDSLLLDTIFITGCKFRLLLPPPIDLRGDDEPDLFCGSIF
jgi:hypothetical protein